jgi:hypothetical protein
MTQSSNRTGEFIVSCPAGECPTSPPPGFTKARGAQPGDRRDRGVGPRSTGTAAVTGPAQPNAAGGATAQTPRHDPDGRVGRPTPPAPTGSPRASLGRPVPTGLRNTGQAPPARWADRSCPEQPGLPGLRRRGARLSLADRSHGLRGTGSRPAVDGRSGRAQLAGSSLAAARAPTAFPTASWDYSLPHARLTRRDVQLPIPRRYDQ